MKKNKKRGKGGKIIKGVKKMPEKYNLISWNVNGLRAAVKKRLPGPFTRA
ncbi:hypothetical protein [Methanosarcina horonobensis]|nr:hypothetical protein [Methanosarcina horonobensis]